MSVINKPFYSRRTGYGAPGQPVDVQGQIGYCPVYKDNRIDLVHGNHVDATTYLRAGGRMTQDIPFRSTSEFQLDSQDFPFYHLEDSKSIYPESAVWEIPGEWPNAENDHHAAITKCLLELSPDGAAFGASLGESSQTVDMFLDTAHTIVNTLSQIKRRDFRGALNSMGLSKREVFSGSTPANFWLQYHFGLTPFMSDLHDLQEQVHKKITATKVTAKGGSGSSRSREWTKNGLIYTQTSKSSVKAVMKAQIVRQGLYRMNNLGLINPASVAWELVPFSFAIDWVMPVGNTLSALTATAGLEFLGGYYNVRKLSTITARSDSHNQYRKDNNGTSRYIVNNQGFCSWDLFEFERWKLEAFPWPEFYAKDSIFMNKDGSAKVARIATALALLR